MYQCMPESSAAYACAGRSPGVIGLRSSARSRNVTRLYNEGCESHLDGLVLSDATLGGLRPYVTQPLEEVENTKNDLYIKRDGFRGRSALKSVFHSQVSNIIEVHLV